MPSIQAGINCNGGGVAIQKTITRSADSALGIEVSLPVGFSGTLTTRTDDNTGVGTLSSGHGLTVSDTVDVYWSGGMRYGMSITAYDDTTVTVDGGAGDNLPVQDTAIVVTPQVQIDTQIDGDDLAMLCIALESTESTGKGHVDLQDSGSSSIEEIDLVANVPQLHDITGGATNVFTGNPITKTFASNGSSSAVATLKIIAAEDVTP